MSNRSKENQDKANQLTYISKKRSYNMRLKKQLMVNDPNVNDDANEIDDRSYKALEDLFQPEEDDQDVEILEDLIDD